MKADFKTMPFDGVPLEDFIRHLAHWPMPHESEAPANRVLIAILMLCEEWDKTHKCY